MVFFIVIEYLILWGFILIKWYILYILWGGVLPLLFVKNIIHDHFKSYHVQYLCFFSKYDLIYDALGLFVISLSINFCINILSDFELLN